MGLSEFFNKHSPWAYQSMTARMLETVRKGYWQADDKIKQKLAVAYAVNVLEKGVACCDHTCNNPMLNQMVVNIISLPGVLSPKVVEQFKLAIEKMGQKTIEEQTAERKELVTRLNEAPGQKTAEASQEMMNKTANRNAAESNEDVEAVAGYKMKDMNSKEKSTDLSSSGIQWFASLFILLLIVLFYLGGRRRR